MKNFYLIFMLLVFGYLLAQNSLYIGNPNDEEQIKWFESGIKYLKKRKPEIALSQFHMAYIYGKKSNLGISARSKIDSLLPIVQKIILKKWKGNWKLKELNYNPYPGTFSEYIRFDEEKITFYQKSQNGQIKLFRSEPIKFVAYDSMQLLNTHQVIFKNSEIWSFWVSKENTPNRLYPKIEKDSTGGMKILLDERGIIIEKKIRKKELKKEIYTYYTQSK